MRNTLAAIALLALVGCASVPAKVAPQTPIENPASTVASVIGELQCDELKGVLIVTKDGQIHAEYNMTPEQIQAIVKGMPAGTVGVVNMTDGCLPKKTA